MHLVEQHVIDRADPRFAIIDEAAFKSKNLYNAALYEIRQAFFHEGKYLNYNEMDRRMQPHEAYKALPAKVSQQILMLLQGNRILASKDFTNSRLESLIASSPS
jgi:putative transposase